MAIDRYPAGAPANLAGKPAPKLPDRPVIDGATAFVDAVSVAGLTAGWQRVWRNGGAAGGDGVTIEAFAAGVADRLVALSTALRAGDYRPGPLRHVDIPKTNGGTRRLTIPSVRDRVAQSAVAQVLTPLLDREFEDSSFGYRPGRGVAQAVARVERLRAEGYVWALDADIDDFFDTIPIDPLAARFAALVGEGPLVELVSLWLEQGSRDGRGVPQGSPLSPLLANLHLDVLDEALSGRGLRLIRYADDFLVLAKDEAAIRDGLKRTTAVLARLGLALDPDKTRIRGYDETLRFLGRCFVRGFSFAGDEPPGFEADLATLAARDRTDAVARDQERNADEAERRSGLKRRIRTLHVGEPGRRLTLRNEAFSVLEAPDAVDPMRGAELAAIHPTRLDRIEIGPRAETDLPTLRHALAHGIAVAFVDGHGTCAGHLAPMLAPRADRHLAQARHVLDPALRLDLARRIVAGRLANQRALLRRVNHRRSMSAVARAAVGLAGLERRLAGACDVPTLMGFEGAGTALYWRAFGRLLLHGFSLAARRRRQGRDPVNIALDVTAGLLARDVGIAVVRAGLHPGFGVLHQPSDARDACVYDLMEEFRAPLAESVVLHLVNTGQLRDSMFPEGPDGMRLNRAGLTVLVRGYEERAEHVVRDRDGSRVTWRGLMDRQAATYAAHCERGEPYRAHVIDH